MSSNADTIKDFLVSLGFDIDQAGANNFETVLKGVTANVMKVGAVVEGAALSIVGFTTRIANGLDKIYWASQRTGASIQGIKALGYAASQTGASAESAMSSLEGLAGFMRSNPGAEGFLNRLGVQTRDASGKMRDTASIFTGVGQKLNNMPYYRAKQYAQMLGIDENTLMAMRRGMNGFTADYQSMLQKTGFNADKAAVQSNKFMTSMRGLTSLFGIMRDKIGSNLAGGLAGSLDSLRRRILDNFPKIEETLTKVIKGVIWLANAFTRMAWRVIQAAGSVIDWWKKLDDGSKKFLMTIGAILIAWRLLNAAFLKSPIGLITTLILAIGLLYDDYQTWKEGGKSLIDWSRWQPEIEQAKKVFKWLRDRFLELKDNLGGWKNTLTLLFSFLAGAKLVSMLAGIGRIVSGFTGLGKAIGSSVGGLAKLARGIAELAIKNPWLLMFIPTNNTPTTSEEMASIGGTGSNIVPERQQAYEALRKENPGKDFFTYEQIQRKIQEMGLEPEQQEQSVKRPRATAQGKILLDWMGPMFNKLESLYQLPAGLLKSVAITESGGNQFAVSGAGAKGLFQFMDGTARDMGLRGNDVFDPEKAAQAAAKYLSQLLRANGGDLSKTLASYNWGIGNVKRYGMRLMPKETRNYIPKVMSNMPASAPVIQQETNINIHGVSDPREAARLTVERQKGVNSQLTQQLPTGPR
ncbi:lytic transglycosylase domain-containing protein [Salmonella enterica subsp. enterica serovar Stanley]|uniref:Lytic transglycosylase domain-containing protein n=1 Tax=Salmonella enterica subsp. enterica serovar Stanley TaxID=192953 RepID=A0A5W5ZEL3_SALET|nr:lytic transglycosylase domain-containing protein [Salmonella enterica]EBW6495938.1 lytic transglycosylase domain-containing protein [Salmonella enterica subsp. enterica serovar Stanley]ECB2490504.1 lytic transglycosylase domain-containing protein [Salmonella enterica subsp. enterica serovar Enteritidis]EDW4514230.1 transglycosylase SLT domain-containing protein [Salmonella enterica subsp. enterica]EBW9931800.1 lytic transglycosylase domain-containing protein [Salmonella enterica subsp. enter